MKNLKTLFQKIERTLKTESHLGSKEFENKFGEFKSYKKRNLTDNDIYQLLVMIIFYSGFKASTVEQKKKVILDYFNDFQEVAKYTENKIQEILSNKRMIKNQKKIRSAVNNAKTFNEIVIAFGSFKKYLSQFKGSESFENLMLLKQELEYKFDFLGGITVYHFLTDLGYEVLKPDRVIQRIYKRLGLIENEKQLLKSVILGRKFAKQNDKPIRYIDIILVKYGQEGKTESFGLNNGICLKRNPKCEKCGVFDECEYENKNMNTGGNNV